MLRVLRRFTDDESGGYTIWFLVWFPLYVAMGGLAVDVSDAYRKQTQLQATCDAAALAGAESLKDTTAAVNNAVLFARSNMELKVDGHVVLPSEVITGNWDYATRTFTLNGTPLNAVRVMARRADRNENPLGTNFLRIIGLSRFNINVDCVAVKDWSQCERNGMLSQDELSIQSNAEFRGNLCLHGAHSVKIGNNNTWGDGNPATWDNLTVSSEIFDNFKRYDNAIKNDHNPGLEVPTYGARSYDNWLLDIMGNLIATYLGDTYSYDGADYDPVAGGVVVADQNDPANYSSPVLPDWLVPHNADNNGYTGDEYGDYVADGPEVVTISDFENNILPAISVKGSVVLTQADGYVWQPETGSGTPENGNGYGPAKAYHIAGCSGVLNIPKGLTLRRTAIISDCPVSVGASTFMDAAIISQGDISFSGGAVLGMLDNCQPGGGVTLISEGDVKTAAKTTISGVQILAKKDVHVAAQADAVQGLSVQAGEKIQTTSKGVWAGCANPDAVDGVWGRVVVALVE